MDRLMTDEEKDRMDHSAEKVAATRFNMVVLKQELMTWMRQLEDASDDRDVRNRCDTFIKLLMKGINRDTGKLQRSRR
jgi:hypothetical protein